MLLHNARAQHRRVRGKTSPKALPVPTAAKSVPRPPKPQGTVGAEPSSSVASFAVEQGASSRAAVPQREEEGQPPVSDGAGTEVSEAEVDERKSLLHRLFGWRRDVWRRLWQFRASVQHARRDQQCQMSAVRQIVLDSKRRRLDEGHAPAGSSSSGDDAAAAREALQALEEISLSTSFSGVDAPCTAFLCMGLGLCEELSLGPEHIPRPRNAYAIEWLQSSQEELAAHPHPPDCIFSDIAEFWNSSIKLRIGNLLAVPEAVDGVLLPLMKAGKATTRKAFCLRHQQMCEARDFVLASGGQAMDEWMSCLWTQKGP